MVVLYRLSDLREIALALARYYRLGMQIFCRLGILIKCCLPAERIMGVDLVYQRFEETVNAFIVELRGNGWINRHIFRIHMPVSPVPLHLLTDITEGIKRSLFLKFVQNYNLSQVQHIYLFELGCCPVFVRHHIDRNIGNFSNLGTALPDAAGLYKDQVKFSCLVYCNRSFNRFTDRFV